MSHPQPVSTLRSPAQGELTWPEPVRTRDLLTLLEVSRAISSTIELEPLLELILDQLKAVTDYAGASVCVVEGETLRIVASRGSTRASRESAAIGLRLPLVQGRALWEALSRQEPAIIANVRGEGALAEGYRTWLGSEIEAPWFRYVRASLLVPLVVHDRVIGLLTMSRREPDYFTTQHARLAGALASQAALAIENARLYAQARADAHRTAALAQIASSVAVAGPLERVLSDLAERVVQTSGALACAVFVTEAELTEAHLGGMHGLLPDYARDLEAHMRAGNLTFTIAQLDPERPLVRHNVWDTYMQRPVLANLLRYRDRMQWDMTVLVPLVSRGRKLGVLANYYHHDREPEAIELAFLAAAGNQAAVAVENDRLLAAVQEKASLEERARLARDLHDSATQTVFSVGMLAQAARTQHERGSERLGETLERVAALAQQAHAEMRALLFELRPDAAVEEGLAQGLGRLVDAVGTRSAATVTLTGTSARRLPTEQAMAVFRIVQEALNNAVKHAQATTVSVSLAEQADQLCVTVEDNGVGFDTTAETTLHGSGLGLRSMRERGAAAGLELRVASTPGAGTTVRITVPTPSA